MDFLDLPRVTRAAGALRLPGSKSISNRTLLLAALARGTTRLERLLDSDDTRVMRNALEALGVRIQALGEERVEVIGVGDAGFAVKRAEIFLGNSGTSARSLTAVLAFGDGHYTLSGVARMHERPIGDLVDALVAAGARIRYLGTPGFPPLAIEPWSRTSAASGPSRIKGNISSQFTSGLLMALAARGGGTAVEVEGELISKPYVEITLASMAQFGVRVEREGWRRFTIPAGASYVSPGVMSVEGDASSASYFLAAGALGTGPVRVEGVGRASVQGDVRFTRALEAMGARIGMGDDWIESAGHAPLEPIDADMIQIPDAAMTAAVLALFARAPSTLRNIGSWRVKETDRIAAMATELRKFGAAVEEGADFLRIAPPATFPSAVTVDTYDDHRMAMCFSLAAFGPARVRINDPGCVSKTFPGYFDAFARLVS